MSGTVSEERRQEANYGVCRQFTWHTSLGCRSDLGSLLKIKQGGEKFPSNLRSILSIVLRDLMDTHIQSYNPRKYVLGSLFIKVKEYMLLHQIELHKQECPEKDIVIAFTQLSCAQHL